MTCISVAQEAMERWQGNQPATHCQYRMQGRGCHGQYLVQPLHEAALKTRQADVSIGVERKFCAFQFLQTAHAFSHGSRTWPRHDTCTYNICYMVMQGKRKLVREQLCALHQPNPLHSLTLQGRLNEALAVLQTLQQSRAQSFKSSA